MGSRDYKFINLGSRDCELNHRIAIASCQLSSYMYMQIFIKLSAAVHELLW